MHEHEEPLPERATNGALRGWLVAKAVRWTARLTMWSLAFLLVAVYGAIAWWRARRAVLGGALDTEAIAAGEPLPSLIARNEGVIGWVRD
jgi:hypothetical protein